MTTQTPDAGAQMVAANMARRKAGKQANTLSDFEPKQNRALEEEELKLPSMEDMLGNAPEPLIRTRHEDGLTQKFYPLPPKLSALSTLMSTVQAASYGEIGNAMLIMSLASLYLYVEDLPTQRKRRATSEEVEDFLGLDDLPLLKLMNEKYLNAIMSGNAEKNA